MSLSRVTRVFSQTKRHLSTNTHPVLPWFVDPVPTSFRDRPTPPHLQSSTSPTKQIPPLPSDAPSALKELHRELSKLPLLEPSTLVVSAPPEIAGGPVLPVRAGQGRRRRGKTYAGEGLGDETANIWDWVVMAQVKEGTEGRGAIDSVVRVVRKTLLSMDPPLPLPPNSKRKEHNGWAMIDAGNFAVHIMSKEVKDKFFTATVQRW